MLWATFAFLAALMTAARSIFEKKGLMNTESGVFTTLLSFGILVAMLPMLVVVEHFTWTPKFFAVTFIVGLLAATALHHSLHAMKRNDISAISPLYILKPAFVAILATIFLGEHLTLKVILGIVIMSVGAYLLEKKHEDSLFEPIRRMATSHALSYVFIAIFLYSISSVIDRGTLESGEVHPVQYQVVLHFWMVLFLLAMHWHKYGNCKALSLALKKSASSIFGVSLIVAAANLTLSYAFSLAPAAQVAAVKSTGSLFIVLAGGSLFHEKGLIKKAIACVVMILGLMLVVGIV
jgi:bacterial/archaeal transporter family protein